MLLKANTRMYNVNPQVQELWAELTRWVGEQSGVALATLDHPSPAPVEKMWARNDLGLVQMCGWPYFRSDPRPVAVAAPVLLDPHAGNEPVYWTDMIVRADSPYRELTDTFGSRIAWTVPGSHSGFNAPRYHLLHHFTERGRSLYRESIGPVITPRGAIEAVVEGRADIAPVDGYFHLLLKRYDASLAEQIRTISRTDRAPIPLMVASIEAPLDAVERLRATLLGACDDTRGNSLLEALLIRRFVPVDPLNYDLGDRWNAAAHAAGYFVPS